MNNPKEHTMKTPTPAAARLAEALEIVESASIRAWATSERNYPIWLKIVEGAMAKGKGEKNALAAYIVCLAIGA
jgi:hypothetical protein